MQVLLEISKRYCARRSKYVDKLALIEGRLFVDPAQHATTEEMKVKSNKILNDVRHLAAVFLVMKVLELPPKEVFT